MVVDSFFWSVNEKFLLHQKVYRKHPATTKYATWTFLQQCLQNPLFRFAEKLWWSKTGQWLYLNWWGISGALLRIRTPKLRVNRLDQCLICITHFGWNFKVLRSEHFLFHILSYICFLKNILPLLFYLCKQKIWLKNAF